jgi:Zn-dependent metalloprotease
MVTIKEALTQLESDPIFNEWKNTNPDSYMCHCLRLMNDEDQWQIGFYNKNDSITTFTVSPLAISQEKTEEVFKKPESKVLPLKINEVDINENQAMKIANEFIKKEYPKEISSKSIIILQNLDQGQVYNITFITMAMNTLNLKIDTKIGEVISHKKTNLMDFNVDTKK